MRIYDLLFHTKKLIDRNIFKVKQIDKSKYELHAYINKNPKQNTNYVVTVNENDEIKCISEKVVPKQTYELDYGIDLDRT